MAHVLPSTIRLEYLAEGAANVVYRFCLPPTSEFYQAQSTLPAADPGSQAERDSLSMDPLPRTTPPPERRDPYDFLRGKLLRLRKDVASTIPYPEQQKIFETKMAPLLPARFLVEQELVLLPGPQLLSRLNNELHSSSKRPAKRQGSLLALKETHGMLLTDMSCHDLMIEMKPKWLAQSPNATSDARRCRTCALRAYRSKGMQLAPRDRASFCPLSLLSTSETNIASATEIVVGQGVSGEARDQLSSALSKFFRRNELLSLLREKQRELDPGGVLRIDAVGDVPDEFLRAMALRDCTLFIAVSNGLVVDARLGDLDVKMPVPSKLEYWKKTEESLISGGWYDGAHPDVGMLCMLSY